MAKTKKDEEKLVPLKPEIPVAPSNGSDLTVSALKQSFDEHRKFTLAKDENTATKHDNFMTLSLSVRDRMMQRWITTQQGYHKQNVKRVYYLSMEFLIGRLLRSSISNLGIQPHVEKALEAYDLNLGDLINEEYDAGLGNGGLGRLAACFLDSMATLGVPASGYGIMYNYGIFHQKIQNGQQVEVPDEWLRLGTPWAIERPEYTIRIKFYGRTHSYMKDKKFCVEWLDTQDVLAMPWDFPVPGYKNDVVNTLRLWSAKGTEEFDLDYFNTGDYVKAYEKKIRSENISKVLYPVDKFSAGMELRLKQEYFFSAASLSDIVRRFKVHNTDFKTFPDKVAIQLNDTHPSIAIPELMRIFLDEEGVEWEDAWAATVKTFAYTNHTLLPEALESWPVALLGQLLPRHMEIIYEINARWLREVADCYPGDMDRLQRLSIIEEGDAKRVRMGFLSVIGSHSVNGVSALHSTLVKTHLFKEFHDITPEKFNNKTNGVTPRRWLLEANPRLAKLLNASIGEQWPTKLDDLRKLNPFMNDAAFRDSWRAIKHENKVDLGAHLKRKYGIETNPEAIFDIQVKRMHEYKRQVLFAFFLVHKYLDIRMNPGKNHVPRVAIFGGKAAPGYGMAKLIIKFINSVAGVIDGDRRVRSLLRVIFMEDYRVSLAQRIIPAADLSEQISTAGTEASGTGCMKFMMNGALTIGTLDGANIEIVEEVGEEHAFIFGLKADEVAKLKVDGYKPREYVDKSPALSEVVKLIQSDFFSQIEPGLFKPILESLLNWDPYMVFADFDAYVAAQNEVEKRYLDKHAWAKSSIANTASSGKFSSDRTIAEYAKEIWGV